MNTQTHLRTHIHLLHMCECLCTLIALLPCTCVSRVYHKLCIVVVAVALAVAVAVVAVAAVVVIAVVAVDCNIWWTPDRAVAD